MELRNWVVHLSKSFANDGGKIFSLIVWSATPRMEQKMGQLEAQLALSVKEICSWVQELYKLLLRGFIVWIERKLLFQMEIGVLRFEKRVGWLKIFWIIEALSFVWGIEILSSEITKESLSFPTIFLFPRLRFSEEYLRLLGDFGFIFILFPLYGCEKASRVSFLLELNSLSTNQSRITFPSKHIIMMISLSTRSQPDKKAISR